MDFLEKILFTIDKDNDNTPIHFFNLKVIESNIKKIREISNLYTNVKVIMAVKSFCEPRILSLIGHSLEGFDVSNISEFELVNDKITNKYVSVCGPAAKWSDFNKLNLANISFDISTKSQLNDALKSPNSLFGVRVRINDYKDDEMIKESHFGFTFETIEMNIPLSKIQGFHFHRGFGNNEVEHYINTVKKILDFIKNKNIKIKYINCGGGYKWKNFQEIVHELVKIVPNDIDLFFEPGDLLFENSGFISTKILDIHDKSDSELDIIVDASKDSHLKWSRPNYLFPQNGKSEIRLNIFGSTCFEGDYIGSFIVLHPKDQLKIGSVLILSQVSGYSYCWNKSFNGISRACLKII